MELKQEKFSPKLHPYTRIRRSPYFEATKRAGCKAYTVYNHMYLPSIYDDMYTEYWKLVNDVTLWDVACERQVEITGPDAFVFLDIFTPRNLTKCKIGQCRYVLICDEDGGIVNDPVLLRLGENHFWLSVSDSDVLLWAKGVAVFADMDVEIWEPDVSPIQVQGPKSPYVMQSLFGNSILELPYYHFTQTKLRDLDVVVSRTGWTAEIGYEVFLRNSSQDGRALRLWDMILEAGKPYNIAVTGPSDIRRLEAGILNYGSDMTRENNPYEVGLDHIVDLDKDFIGKEALKKIKAQGVRRKLVGLEIDSEPMLEGIDDFSPPALVKDNGTQIGRITAAFYSPRLRKNIAHAMIAIEYSQLETQVTVEVPGGQRKATVVQRPFYDPKKEIPKSQLRA